MNELTKFLVDGVLNESVEQITALFGGGFKPPTKGHLDVVLNGLKQNPEINNLKIIVGGGVRDSITQDQSTKIWELYRDIGFIPVETEIIKANPFNYYKEYLKSNPDDKTYVFIGSREGSEGDQFDLNQRTQFIKKYSDNVIPVEISTTGGISGTEARKLFKTDLESFKDMLPEKLTVGDIKKIVDILNGKSKDSTNNPSFDKTEPLSPLNEGRYDTISNQISSDIFTYWKDNITDRVITFEKTYQHEGEDIDVEATLKQTPEIEYLNVDGGADDETDYILVSFEVNPYELPQAFKDISFNLKDVVRHEIEHLTHGEGFMSKSGKYMENDEMIRKMIDMEFLPKSSYFTLEKEVDANLQGMYFRAKKERRPFRDVIDVYLDAQKITPEEKEKIINIWSKRTKALGLPSIEDEELLNEIDLKKYVDKAKEGFKKFLGALKQEGKETKEAFKLLSQSVKGEKQLSKEEKKEIGNQLKDIFKTVGYLGLFALPGGSVFTILFNLLKLNKYVLPSAFQSEGLNEAIVGDKIECDKCDWSWDIKDGGDDLYVCHKCGYDNEPLNESKDPFGLIQFVNEVAEESEFDYTKHIDSLNDYMVKNKMNVSPLPKVTFIDDDVENANDVMGKTAYYDPNKREVVLYTLLRHPKDILRSYAHEMIHHIQNLEDRLGNITTTNTTEDDHLTDIEREAYTDGNLTFRKWTETINESLNEGKQVGILYHVTSPERYKQIMDQNMLKGGLVTINGKETLGISTTRNKNFKYGGNTVQIALDGDKLSNRYKIKPYDYWERNYNLPNNPQAQDEDEEIILTPSITNIKDYILTTNLNEISNQEMKYWAFHGDIFSELRKGGVEKYNEFRKLAKGERLQAIEHFWDLLEKGKLSEDAKNLAPQEEVRIFDENCGCNEA